MDQSPIMANLPALRNLHQEGSENGAAAQIGCMLTTVALPSYAREKLVQSVVELFLGFVMWKRQRIRTSSERVICGLCWDLGY